MMPEEITTPTIADDIRTVEDYSKNLHETATQGSHIGYGWLFGGCIAAAGCSVFNLPLAALISILVGAVIGASETNRYKQRSHIRLPQDAVNRIVTSNEPRAIAFMFRAYEVDSWHWGGRITKGLAAAISRASSADTRIDGLAFWEKVRNLLSTQVENGRYQSSADAELLLASIETLVRWRKVQCLSKLLMVCNISAPTPELQRVREAANLAVAELSVHANFGEKSDIPAMVSELFPLIDQGGVWMSGQRERQLWLIYALTLQLPTVTKEDAKNFDSPLFSRLRSLLSLSTEYGFGVSERVKSELRQATLLAMGNMEDLKAISLIEALTRMEAPTDHEQQTRSLARKQLSKLTRIREQQAVGSMLLRASDAPATAQDQLLRPASPTADTMETEQLLRPHNGAS